MAQVFVFCNPQNAGVAALLPNLQGYVEIEPIVPPASNPNWRAMILRGTAAQLAPLDALPTGFLAICLLSVGDSKWPELNDTVNADKRTKMNTWLQANGYDLIGEDWNNGQVIEYIMQTVFQNNYSVHEYWV